MSEMRHERPGVYSVYDASSVTSAGRAAKRIGVAALAVKGTANTAVTLTGYGAGVEAFGEDGADTPGMSTLLKLLFANGASTVYAVRVGAGGGLEAYQAAFAALANCDVQVVVCDSSELTIQKALKTAVETASAARGERIGVIGGSGIAHADPQRGHRYGIAALRSKGGDRQISLRCDADNTAFRIRTVVHAE